MTVTGGGGYSARESDDGIERDPTMTGGKPRAVTVSDGIQPDDGNDRASPVTSVNAINVGVSSSCIYQQSVTFNKAMTMVMAGWRQQRWRRQHGQ